MEDQKSNKEADGVSLREILEKVNIWYKYLISRWKVILLTGIFMGIFGYIYAYYQKTVYVASTTFVLESNEGSGTLSQYAGLASMAGIDIGSSGGGGLFQGDNIIELYKSRSMIEKTLLSETLEAGKKRLLVDLYIDFNHLRKQWVKYPQLQKIEFNTNSKNISPIALRQKDSILNSISNSIREKYLSVTKPDKKLGIFKVEVKAVNEQFAKDFNNMIVRNVNDFYIQTKTKKSKRNVSILAEKADSVKAVMNGAIYAVSVISDATPNLNPTRQVQRTAPVQRSQFSAETNKAILGELVKNLELAKMALMKDMPLIQIIDEPVYPLDKIKLGNLKGALIGLFLGLIIAISVLLIKRITNDIMTN